MPDLGFGRISHAGPLAAVQADLENAGILPPSPLPSLDPLRPVLLGTATFLIGFGLGVLANLIVSAIVQYVS